MAASGISLRRKIFLNKMPFNSLRLPLIGKLFPEAKVLLSIRDPRDVVLSCFRNHFDISSMTFEFLALDDCARFYAAVMELVDLYRQKLPLTLLECRYEDIVTDFDTTIARICAFSGIPQTDSMHEFARAAETIDRRNPSAAQLARGLYTSGIGQWRRYRDQLEPVLPILKNWIDRFGYPAH
ncbi:MAG TPA: sulfotransferase [Rhizomicrobium sp.]